MNKSNLEVDAVETPLGATPAPAAAPAPGTKPPRTRRELFWLVAKIVLGLLALALVIAFAVLRTWPPLNVVQTSSMEPMLEPGDVAIMGRLDRPAEVGDVIEVSPPQEIQDRLNYPDRIIHRIVRISPEGLVYTKGDARNQRDPFTVPLDDVQVRVVGEIPNVGQIIGFFTSPLGLLWLGVGVLLFVLLPYFDLRRDQLELEKAEMSSIADLHLELQELGERIDESGGGSRAPPVYATPITEDGNWVDQAEASQAAGAEDELARTHETVEELVGAVREYGEHLRSHTAVLMGMSTASRDLADTAASLRAALPGTQAELATLESRARALTDEAEINLAAWRDARATEIAASIGFRDPRDAARLADLEATARYDDDSVRRAVIALAEAKPYLIDERAQADSPPTGNETA